jgi:hypothetical protein
VTLGGGGGGEAVAERRVVEKVFDGGGEGGGVAMGTRRAVELWVATLRIAGGVGGDDGDAGGHGFDEDQAEAFGSRRGGRGGRSDGGRRAGAGRTRAG